MLNDNGRTGTFDFTPEFNYGLLFLTFNMIFIDLVCGKYPLMWQIRSSLF